MSKEKELATSICKLLFEEGYIAYFAGGWVRDLLLNKETDEIDIATSAPPRVIEKLFPKTIPVGAFFGVMIVVLEGIQFEVTTFRKDHPYADGRHPESVDFSTPEKDALRRDFTINGMFYDPLTEEIFDFVEGRRDLEKKIIRAIGEPDERFKEDRLRMIRAVRFSTKLHFKIEEKTEKAILKHAHTLFPSVSMERIWQELNKMRPFDTGIILLHRLGLLATIFPALKDTPITEIERRVAPFKYFPINTPTIIYIMELFPHASLTERIEISHYLKTTNKDVKLLQFFFSAEKLFAQNTVESYEWAHFYAHPDHLLFLETKAAKILPPERGHFLKEHKTKEKELQFHITHIKKRHPILRASHLKKEGILPGKKMGLLLKQGERLAINEDLRTHQDVLERLKEDPLWHEVSDL